MNHKHRPATALLASSALAMALGGCKFDNRPLLARNDAPPPAYAGAPALGPLDPGQAAYAPAPIAAAYPEPAQTYAYAYPQRAYAISRAVYDAPPNYAFGYGEEQPWAWDVADDGMMFAEPIDDGYRYYYYDPGDPYPYFVQDPDYSYAYGDGGALIAIFGAAGALLAADQYGPLEYRAHDYWRRGYSMDEAYQRSPRQAVDPQVWRARAPAVTAGHDRWFQAAAAQPAWRSAAAQIPAGYDPRRDNGRQFGLPARGRQVAMAAPAMGAAAAGVGAAAFAAHQAHMGPLSGRAQAAGGGWSAHQAQLAEARTHGGAAPQRLAQQSAPTRQAQVAALRGQGQHGAHGEAPGARSFAQAQPHAAPQMAHAGRGGQEHGARAAQAQPPRAARGFAHETHQGPAPQRFAHAGAPPAPPTAHVPPVGGGGHGGGGGHAMAMAAQSHAAPAAFHAPAPPPQAHPGGGGGQPHPQGGGGHGGNPGGGQHGRDKH